MIPLWRACAGCAEANMERSGLVRSGLPVAVSWPRHRPRRPDGRRGLRDLPAARPAGRAAPGFARFFIPRRRTRPRGLFLPYAARAACGLPWRAGDHGNAGLAHCGGCPSGPACQGSGYRPRVRACPRSGQGPESGWRKPHAVPADFGAEFALHPPGGSVTGRGGSLGLPRERLAGDCGPAGWVREH